MALTAITISASNVIPYAGSLIEPGTAAIDATNGNSLALPSPQGGDRVVLRIVNSTGSTKVVTIAAGNSSAAINSAALAISMATTEIRYVLVDTAKHLNTDNTITITYAAGTTGTVQVLVLPVGA